MTKHAWSRLVFATLLGIGLTACHAGVSALVSPGMAPVAPPPTAQPVQAASLAGIKNAFHRESASTCTAESLADFVALENTTTASLCETALS